MSKTSHADWTVGGPNTASGFGTIPSFGESYSLTSDFSGAALALSVAAISAGLGAAIAVAAPS